MKNYEKTKLADAQDKVRAISRSPRAAPAVSASGYVQGEMDLRYADRRADFSWNGMDEMTEVSGRGHAELQNGELCGRIFIHLGDDSVFRAVKAPRKA